MSIRKRRKKGFLLFLLSIKAKIVTFFNKKTLLEQVNKITKIKLFQKQQYSEYKKIFTGYLSVLAGYINKQRLTAFWNTVKNISWKSPKTIGISALALAVIAGGVYYFSVTTSAVAIQVNGKTLGYAQNMTEAEQIVQQVLAQQGGASGKSAKTSDVIEYDRVRLSKDAFNSQKITAAQLMDEITPYIDGCALYIGEKTVAYLASAEDADATLQKYIDYFTKPSESNTITSVEFAEKIDKVAVQVSPSEIKTVDQAVEILIKGDMTENTYTVQKDDSFWLIARKNGMLTNEVIASNPGFTEDTILQPGQKLKIVKVEPFLTVISKGTRVVNEIIPFDVQTKLNTKLAAGKSVVQQSGKDGEKKVTYNYVEKNGQVIDKQVIKEEVISKPVTQIIATGPAKKSTVYVGTSRGSGSISGLQWPLSGRITSYYGYRSGGFHSGIDIDGVTGQPYTAAASGTVVMAGWNGAYGYCIVVDHGNGVATRYAHSSKLFVSTGDKVNKGQTIGNVGSTGNSTGSHLHFEVIINGSTVNPLNYL